MSSAEGAPLLPSERDAPARRIVSSSARWLLLGLGALFAVFACGAVAVVEYRNRFGISEDEIHARSSRAYVWSCVRWSRGGGPPTTSRCCCG